MEILVQNQKLPYFYSKMNKYSGRHIRVALTILTISAIFSMHINAWKSNYSTSASIEGTHKPGRKWVDFSYMQSGNCNSRFVKFQGISYVSQPSFQFWEEIKTHGCQACSNETAFWVNFKNL